MVDDAEPKYPIGQMEAKTSMFKDKQGDVGSKDEDEVESKLKADSRFEMGSNQGPLMKESSESKEGIKNISYEVKKP